jgi:ABC-type branched-subunit amino acid transport system substrate-binding protein
MYDAFVHVYCSGDGIDCEDDQTFFPRAYDVEDLGTSLGTVVTELAAWEPDVTVAFSYTEDSLAFFTIVGTNNMPLNSLLWNSSIASDVLFGVLATDYHSVLCQLQASTQKMPSGLVYTSFLTRYRSVWGEDPIPYTANFYDAAYMLAYAYAAASDDNPNPDGLEIADAMERLSTGTSIEAGSADWTTGIQALLSDSSATIDYVGASGDVNFTGGTGTIVAPVEAVRFNVGDLAVESVGVFYNEDDIYSAPNYDDIVDSICGENIAP